MSVWILIQVVLNVLFLLGFSIIWLRLKRPAKDDPRLSRGLQLLQSKITVLEDLSDRTDRQVNQLTSLLDQKTRMLQSKIFDAENQIQKVQGSMDRSLEVAEIFQDKIPHDEIIERQNTVKYIRAARLAHSGKNVDDIVDEVDLPREQVEFIAKVNKDKLMFDEDRLPAWAEKPIAREQLNFFLQDDDEINSIDSQEEDVPVANTFDIDPTAFDLPQASYDSLKRLGDEFRQACETYETVQKSSTESQSRTTDEQSQLYKAAKQVTQKLVDGVSEFIHDPFHKEDGDKLMKSASSQREPVSTQVKTSVMTSESQSTDKKPKIQKVIFPRIDLDDPLRK